MNNKSREQVIEDKGLGEKFEFRCIKQDEVEQAVTIEQICFPPHEACSERHMRERIERVPELFLVAVDKKTEKIAGFVNGLATNENTFRDEFFTNADLHTQDGKNIMILGLDVLPEYRNQGLARELMARFLRQARENNRKLITLTCLESKVNM